MQTLEIRNLFGKPPSVVDRTRRHLVLGDDPVGDGDPVIVFTESGGLVDDPGTRGGLDVAVADDSVGSVLKLARVAESGVSGDDDPLQEPEIGKKDSPRD
jgi:hypothetical protein